MLPNVAHGDALNNLPTNTHSFSQHYSYGKTAQFPWIENENVYNAKLIRMQHTRHPILMPARKPKQILLPMSAFQSG